MQLTGDVSIAAPRIRVWAALNDPQVLARCIDGVETLTRVAGEGGERFEGKMNAKVGPVRATFTGQVTLADVNAPESYRLVGEGKGGVAGFAKGEAAVHLEEPSPGTTLLHYDVTSSVGGKLAQLGARLIEGTAKAYAETFFARLKAEVENAPGVSELAEALPGLTPRPASAEPHPPASVVTPGKTSTGIPPLVWGGAIVLAVVLFFLFQWQ